MYSLKIILHGNKFSLYFHVTVRMQRCTIVAPCMDALVPDSGLCVQQGVTVVTFVVGELNILSIGLDSMCELTLAIYLSSLSRQVMACFINVACFINT